MAGLAPLNNDIPGHQVPGPANAIDDEPLEFDVILHAGPPDQDRAAVQNVHFPPQINMPDLDVVQEGPEPDGAPMQEGPAGANALQIDFAHQGHAEEAGVFHDIGLFEHPYAGLPNDWVVALNAIGAVMSLLQTGHPAFATSPTGTERTMALHAALTQYMLAHGLPVNVPAPAVAPVQQNLPPLHGFVDLVGHLDVVDEGLNPGPDVQDDEFADLGGPPEDDEIDWEEQVGHVNQVIDEVEAGPAHFLQPMPLPEVEDVLQPALVMAPEPVIAAAAADGDHALEPAVNLAAPLDEPPPYVPNPNAGHADGADGGVNEPVIDQVGGGVDLAEDHALPGPAAEAHNPIVPAVELAQGLPAAGVQAPAIPVSLDVEGNSVPGPSSAHTDLNMLEPLDEDARAALSSLCSTFAVADDAYRLNTVLVEAVERMTRLQNMLNEQQRETRPPLDAGMSLIDHPNVRTKAERRGQTFKLRSAWSKAFARLHPKSASDREPSLHPVASSGIRL